MRGSIKVSKEFQARVSQALTKLGLPRVVTRSQIEFEIGIRTWNIPPDRELKQRVSVAIGHARFNKGGKKLMYRRDSKNWPRFELVEKGRI